MIRPEVYAARRNTLRSKVNGPILLMGNGVRDRNLPGYGLPFRQDSTYLYFTGCALPNTAVLIDDSGETLFVPPPAADDALWHGHVDTIAQIGQRFGFDRVKPLDALPEACRPLKETLQTAAIPDVTANQRAAELTGRSS
ncbi:MAG: aminopeptidase P N-terminal domain-containing protein, partial [Myxococcota bacterium]